MLFHHPSEGARPGPGREDLFRDRIGLRKSERLAGRKTDIDIDRGSQPCQNPSLVVSLRQSSHQMPAIGAVRPLQQILRGIICRKDINFGGKVHGDIINDI